MTAAARPPHLLAPGAFGPSTILRAAVLSCLAVLSWLAVLAPLGTAQDAVVPVPSAAREPYEPVASYAMDVRLQPDSRILNGSQTIAWRNTTTAVAAEVRLHLYWNAFRDLRSSLMRESDAAFRARFGADDHGFVDLIRVQARRADGGLADLEPEFVQPDDGNRDDHTVVRCALPEPVVPGAELVLETTFRARAPTAWLRAGFAAPDGFFGMQWFPKLGVFESGGSGDGYWHCPQFHRNTEFHSDFGTYDVTLELPADFVVGATGGEPVSRERVGEDRIRLRFVAERVHDFAWVADPDFVEVTAELDRVVAAADPTGVASSIAKSLDVPVDTLDVAPLRVRLLLQPEHDTAEHRERYLDGLRCAHAFYGLRFGAYPYPWLTLVDPPHDLAGNSFGGGMEYPMLITGGAPLRPHPRALRPESVTVHEFGHQYWYGLCANDEVREAWLDEGINTFSEGRAQLLAFGPLRAPLRTTDVAGTTVAAVFAPTVPGAEHLPWRTLPVDSWLPAGLAAPLSEARFAGTWLPRSPILEWLAVQPTLGGFREVRATDFWNDRDRWLAVDDPDGLQQAGWQMLDRASYRANAYTEPATLLRSIERLVGRAAFWSFLHRFHQAHRFGRPTTEAFEARLRSELGVEAAEVFRAARQPGACFEMALGAIDADPTDGRQSVVVRRLGDLRLHVRIRFRFAGRPEPVWRTYPASEPHPWLRFDFVDQPDDAPFGPLEEVWIDPPVGSHAAGGEPFEAEVGPCGVWVIERDLTDNAWRATPDARPAALRAIRVLQQLQTRFSFAGAIG